MRKGQLENLVLCGKINDKRAGPQRQGNSHIMQLKTWLKVDSVANCVRCIKTGTNGNADVLRPYLLGPSSEAHKSFLGLFFLVVW